MSKRRAPGERGDRDTKKPRGAERTITRGIYAWEDEEDKEWKEALAGFENKVSCYCLGYQYGTNTHQLGQQHFTFTWEMMCRCQGLKAGKRRWSSVGSIVVLGAVMSTATSSMS